MPETASLLHSFSPSHFLLPQEAHSTISRSPSPPKQSTAFLPNVRVPSMSGISMPHIHGFPHVSMRRTPKKTLRKPRLYKIDTQCTSTKSFEQAFAGHLSVFASPSSSPASANATLDAYASTVHYQPMRSLTDLSSSFKTAFVVQSSKTSPSFSRFESRLNGYSNMSAVFGGLQSCSPRSPLPADPMFGEDDNGSSTGSERASSPESIWNLIPYNVPWGSSYYGYKKGTLPGPDGKAILLRSPTPLKNQRTGQACEKCRERKAKCSGARPSCARCVARGHACEYGPYLKRSKNGDAESDEEDDEDSDDDDGSVDTNESPRSLSRSPTGSSSNSICSVEQRSAIGRKRSNTYSGHSHSATPWPRQPPTRRRSIFERTRTEHTTTFKKRRLFDADTREVSTDIETQESMFLQAQLSGVRGYGSPTRNRNLSSGPSGSESILFFPSSRSEASPSTQGLSESDPGDELARGHVSISRPGFSLDIFGSDVEPANAENPCPDLFCDNSVWGGGVPCGSTDAWPCTELSSQHFVTSSSMADGSSSHGIGDYDGVCDSYCPSASVLSQPPDFWVPAPELNMHVGGFECKPEADPVQDILNYPFEFTSDSVYDTSVELNSLTGVQCQSNLDAFVELSQDVASVVSSDLAPYWPNAADHFPQETFASPPPLLPPFRID